MKLIDISWPITKNMTPYKERQLVQFSHLKSWEKDRLRQSQLLLDMHAGTHVDAPAHFLQHGTTIDQFSIQQLVGSCVVLECMDVQKIRSSDVEGRDIRLGDIVLFKTKNSLLSSEDVFNSDFVYVEKSAAEFLVQQKVKAVGIDYIGIERDQPQHETHTVLLSKNIPIIEGLRLRQVHPGRYTLFCFPLAVKGLEAAPARAFLMVE